MNTRDRAEALVEELHDMACDGEVAEVLVVCRASDGRLLAAYASDDMARLIDDARAVLADAEADFDAQQPHRLN